MKVLSLTEPYATLIKNEIKTIETRSWKTNYRGIIYSCKSYENVPIYKRKCRTNVSSG